MRALYRMLLASLLVFGLLPAIHPVLAQEITAAVNGTVTDKTGGAVSGAKVGAKDLDRGTIYPTTTGGDGSYSLPRLPVGRYEIRVEHPGFQTAVQSNVTLVLNQVAKVDFELQVGNVSQTVEVTTAAPVLQTETTQLGTVLDARTNVALPLATRNYNQLTLLAPGAITTSPTAFTGSQSTFNSGRPYVNGNREQADNYILDGMDNNQISENDVGYAPSVDAIQEFALITQNASAEFGNFMGGTINVSLKSGTNQFHGVAFEFIRNDKLNANEWKNNFQDIPRPLLRWNEFGGAVGGPIKRDRLFFFADYQGSRYDQPATGAGFTVFTAAERTGNFSAICTAGFKNGVCNNPAQQLYNPYSSSTSGNRSPFLNNTISPTLFSKEAMAILSSSLYPAPINGNLVNNQINTSHTYTNGDQGDIKIDWAASDKDHIFGRYSQQKVVNPATNSQPLLYNTFNNYPLYNGVVDYTRTFSPTFVNDLRGGVNYYPVATGAANPGSSSNFGLPGAPSSFLPGLTFLGGNITNFGNADITQDFASTVIEAEDTAILTRGPHTIRAGFQYFRDRINVFYSGNEGLAGVFTFNGQYTGNTVNGVSTNGLPEADFLLGLPQQVGVGAGGGTWGQRSSVLAAFVEDDWKVTPKLTVNLGLRWELHTPWDEVHNRQTNFQEFTGTVLLSGQTNLFNNNNALYNQYNGIANWQPRIGVAYSPDQHTVIRASYTLSSFLEGTGTNLRLTRNPPWQTGHLVTYSSGSSLVLPPTTLDQGFAGFAANGTCTPALALASSPACFAGATIFTWDPNNRPALSNQWNLSIQHQFGATTTLQLAYVGQNNDHLMVPINASQSYLASNGTVYPSPYLAGNPTLLAAGPTDKLTATNGVQNYNALQVSLAKRLSSGLEFQANYTWSKCLTNSIGYYGLYGDLNAAVDQSGGNYFYWQNTYDAHGNYGPCYYDAEHAFNGFVTYDIPFGRNRMFGKSMNKAVNAVVGDWQVNSIVTIHSGFPFTISGNDASGTGSFGSLASCSGPPVVYGKKNSPLGGYQWWSQSSFYQPSSGFGNCGIGIVRGPGLHTADLSVSKLFSFTEHTNLEFRAEAINFTNTKILAGPNSGLGPDLGLVNNSQGARNLQFGLKFNF
ncbi:MAG TPA: carboxypeptidase regulatory-like domain-containing protein [Bryobacteraceae bacterium]|nr:carboxypeptidase regulatory-like domain-containing protein [Bryobacteraceae bacterium]